MQSHHQSEFCANLMYDRSPSNLMGSCVWRIGPRLGGLPHLERLNGKIWPWLRGLPGLADRATRVGGSPYLSCKRDQIKMRYYMDRRVTPPKRVTSPTWGPPPPCKQTLSSILYWSNCLVHYTFFKNALMIHEFNNLSRPLKSVRCWCFKAR